MTDFNIDINNGYEDFQNSSSDFLWPPGWNTATIIGAEIARNKKNTGNNFVVEFESGEIKKKFYYAFDNPSKDTRHIAIRCISAIANCSGLTQAEFNNLKDHKELLLGRSLDVEIEYKKSGEYTNMEITRKGYAPAGTKAGQTQTHKPTDDDDIGF